MSRRSASRADVCAIAVAECFRGDGEILANPIGTIPDDRRSTRAGDVRARPGDDRRRGAARRATASRSVGRPRQGRRGVEPVPHDVRRRVVGPSSRDDGRERRLDPYGNQNFAFIGDPAQAEGAAARHARRARQHDQRHDQLLDPRRTHRACSSRRSTSCRGVGYDRAAELGDWVKAHHELRARRHQPRACSTSAVPTTACASLSVHPGVTVDDVVAATGFELAVADDVAGDAPADRRGDRA